MVIGAILHTDMTVHQATVDMLVAREGFSAEPSEADRADMVNTVVHAMDLNNVAVPWAECVKWARRVGKEFSAQVLPKVPDHTVSLVARIILSSPMCAMRAVRAGATGR